MDRLTQQDWQIIVESLGWSARYVSNRAINYRPGDPEYYARMAVQREKDADRIMAVKQKVKQRLKK